MHILALTRYYNKPASLVYIIMKAAIQGWETALEKSGGTDKLESLCSRKTEGSLNKYGSLSTTFILKGL